MRTYESEASSAPAGALSQQTWAILHSILIAIPDFGTEYIPISFDVPRARFSLREQALGEKGCPHRDRGRSGTHGTCSTDIQQFFEHCFKVRKQFDTGMSSPKNRKLAKQISVDSVPLPETQASVQCLLVVVRTGHYQTICIDPCWNQVRVI